MSDTPNTTQKSLLGTWQDWATRATAVLAVLAALSSGRWGASNLQAILEQGKVNDAWAYYQANSIKAHGAEQMEKLAEAMKQDASPDKVKTLEALQKDFAKTASEKNADKAKVRKDAESFEQGRDKYVARGFWFEISFAALQLGVILATISAAAKSKGLLFTSVAVGLFGLVLLAQGFFLWNPGNPKWYQGVSQGMNYDPSSSDAGAK